MASTVFCIIAENGAPDLFGPQTNVEPVVNRQPGFRQELVEQNILHFQDFLVKRTPK